MDVYLYGAGRIAQYDASGAQYFLGDELGSVRHLVDANGEVLLAQSYEPYGAVLESAGEGTSSYGFAAEMRDPTGLIFLRARYYNSRFGRFLSKDTWPGDYNHPLSLNGWNYVEADPVNFIDPSGLYSQRQIKQILGVDTYDEVLDVFENGKLAGKWAFLEVLHQGNNGDKLSIYQIGQCRAPSVGPEIGLPTITIEGNSFLARQKVGTLYFLPDYGLLMMDESKTGWPVLWYVPEADYLALEPRRGYLFKSWANKQYPTIRLIEDSVDWGDFWADTVDLSAYLISDGRFKALGHALERIGTGFDVYDLWHAMRPTIDALARGNIPDEGDLKPILEAARDLGYENAVEYQGNDVPVYQFIILLKNLGSSIRFSP